MNSSPQTTTNWDNWDEHVCVYINNIYIYYVLAIMYYIVYNINDKTDESLAAAVALSHHDEDAREN